MFTNKHLVFYICRKSNIIFSSWPIREIIPIAYVLVLSFREYFFAIYKLKKIVLEPRHDKTNKISVRPSKTQIGLGIRPVWSKSSLCAQWIARDPSFLHADSEDSDQTGRMPRLFWVFARRTATFLVLSCRGSLYDTVMLHFRINPWELHFRKDPWDFVYLV